MSLVAGSYERFIYGFKLKTLKHSTESLTLSPIFSFPSHLSPIKSVAGSDGSNDTIKIYDLFTSSEVGSFNDPTATVTSLVLFTDHSLSSFPGNLFLAYDDVNISFYDVNLFVNMKTMKIHKKCVNNISVHPSGKLVLKVGRDSCLGMVNSVRGMRSFSCRLGKESSIVEFDYGGEKFFMETDENILVHKAEDAKRITELESKKRVICITTVMVGLVYDYILL